MSIGISVDEGDAGPRRRRRVHAQHFPLLDLGWRREDCVRFLDRHGLGDTPKSSCLGCPYHDDQFWAHLKATSPVEWADAVAFDNAIRHGSARPANADGHPLRGQFFLHASRMPLDQAVLRPRPAPAGDAPGCGPFTCPHSDPINPTFETATDAHQVASAATGREVA